MDNRAESLLLPESMLIEAAARFGTPLYVYDLVAVRARARGLADLFGGRFEISYAVKANPNMGLLRGLNGYVPLIDVSSIGEVRCALEAGFAPSTISFTGPAKRDDEIREAIEAGIGYLIIESLDEAQSASAIAGSLGKQQPVLVRLAPARVPKGFGLNMSGRPTQFGIDEEDMEVALPQLHALPGLCVEGFHAYSGTQCLKADAVAENHAIMAALFARAADIIDIAPKHIVFGGGMGVAMHDGEAPLDEAAVAAADIALIDGLKQNPRFAQTSCALEIGRALVAAAGWFVTSVVRVKESRGQRIAIVDGGLNNHLAATGNFGAAIRRNYRLAAVGNSANTTASYDVVGPLCTTIDLLGQKVVLPSLDKGALVAIEMSGAYGLSASPVNFISHPAPHEVLWDGTDFQDVTEG